MSMLSYRHWLTIVVFWFLYPSVCPAQSVHDLIERLASPNRAPERVYEGPRDEVKIVYPPNYDYKVQKTVDKRVYESWDALLAKGNEALFQLAQSIDDQRYSHTLTWGAKRLYDDFQIFTVGSIAAEIMQTEIEVYRWFVPDETEFHWKPHFVQGIGAPKGLRPHVFKKWWKEQQGKDLHTLQTEAVQWAINYEQKKTDLSPKEMSLVFEALDAVQKRLQSSKKPILVDRKGQFLGDDATLFKKHLDRLDRVKKEREKIRRAAMKYYLRGRESMYFKNDTNKAIADFTEALRIDPTYNEVYYDRASVYESKGDFDKAITDYSELIRRNKNDTSLYEWRGRVYAKKGDYDKAISDYSEAIRLMPDSNSLYSSRGRIYAKKGDFDKAIADYSKDIQLEPGVINAYLDRSKIYLKKGNLDKVIADYSEIIRIDPKSYAMYIWRGDLYAKKGDFKKAIADYSEAIRIQPDYGEIYHKRGVIYEKTGDKAKAEADFKLAKKYGCEIGEDSNHKQQREKRTKSSE